MAAFDGDGPDDQKLWHTYFYLARNAVLAFLPEAPPSCDSAITDDPANRLPDATAAALQAIVLAAFVLEYRLKRVLTCLGVRPLEDDSLRSLVDGFWGRVGAVHRLDGKGTCRRPPEWEGVGRRLVELVDLRNLIAHANYRELLDRCRDHSIDQRAPVLYLAVVEAIKLVNIHTGYDTRDVAEIDRYFLPVTVRPSPAVGQ